MNFFKKLKSPFRPTSIYYTLITGPQLKYTNDIIKILSCHYPNMNFLVLNKNHEDENINEDNINLLKHHDKVQIFNCDFKIEEDVEEFSFYLKSKPDIKIKNIIHSDHYISSLDHSKSTIYSELKLMTQTNIEIPMIINSKLLSLKKLEIDSKIIHLILPNTKNLENIIEFNPKRMMGQSLKHMVNCLKEDLIKNPVFFSMVDIQTCDELYLKRFENNETIRKEELQKYKQNYPKSLELINLLISPKLSGLEFGKKFWNINDLDSLKSI